MKPVTTKTVAKKTAAKNMIAKTAAAKKPVVKKVMVKKTVAKKTVAKKTAAEKAGAKKPVSRKVVKLRLRKFDLVIDRAKGAKWSNEDIRPQFEYRHFGVEEATGRQYGSHVIRVAKGARPPVRHHVHPDCEFLLVYVLKGWVKFWYDGEGEVRLNVGDVHLLPAGISHAVTGWSKDLEMLETTNPADYRSVELTDEQIARQG
jgi:quercetin dioxygenase-like cupin family protein